MKVNRNYSLKLQLSKTHLLIFIIISIIFFILGITLPVFKTTKFYFIKEDITILKSIWILLTSGSLDIFLGIVIFIFSIVFPLLKYVGIVLLLSSVSSKNLHTIHKLIERYGKFSMVDVFVIALVIIVMKMGNGIFFVQLKLGTVCFTLSVLSSIFIVSILKRNLSQYSVRKAFYKKDFKLPSIYKFKNIEKNDENISKTITRNDKYYSK